MNPHAATYISDAQIKAVAATPGSDRTVRVVDIGPENLALGVVQRGPTTAVGGGSAPPASTADACGQPATGVVTGPSGTTHDQQTEAYYILSGSGTLATGGHIVNGRRSAADSDTTTTLNGPSCSGAIVGTDVVTKSVAVGDVVIVPAGVPHGWVSIPDHLDYLSFRPSARVLKAGYAHPAIRNGE
jgi:mannose-6-phosphate isomerase-like protein (cupin superfamily)